MCVVGKTSIISCQVSFYPLYTAYPIPMVKEAVEMMESSDLDVQVNDMSTIIKGRNDQVMALLTRIQNRMNEKKCEFTMVITLSNVCGCRIS